MHNPSSLTFLVILFFYSIIHSFVRSFFRSFVQLYFFFSDGGRELYFPDYYFFASKRLVNHVIISGPVKDLDECEYRCYLNANCVSLNIKDHHNRTHECELNNSTHLEHDKDLEDNQLYYYRGAEVSNYFRVAFVSVSKIVFV